MTGADAAGQARAYPGRMPIVSAGAKAAQRAQKVRAKINKKRKMEGR